MLIFAFKINVKYTRIDLYSVHNSVGVHKIEKWCQSVLYYLIVWIIRCIYSRNTMHYGSQLPGRPCLPLITCAARLHHYPGCLVRDDNLTRQIWGIWKLRPAYSPETPDLGQNRLCFVPCDLEIWWMTLENNRASLLWCFKLCATFHSHRWIQTGVTVRKRPIWVKFDDF